MSAKTVLISGAGIAGPTLAFWLKSTGFEPTIVERAPELRRGGYVIDFWGLGYDVAERMGLTREIDRVGYHIRELRIVNANGKRIAGFGTNVFSELTGGRYVTIERSALSQLLFEKIKDTTEIIFGNEIVAVQELADHVLVKLKHGAERRFDLVIGADGLHSAVRRLVFGPQDAFEKKLGYIVAAFEASGYRPRDEDVYVVYSAPGRMLGRVALHDDRTLFLFVCAADVDTTFLDLSGRKAMLRDKFADRKWESERILDELTRSKELYFDRVSQIKINRWSRGRVALVGDAAFCVSLLAGQGSALAMAAAFVLAGELSKAGGRHEQAFANYERILRAYINVKQRGAERFASAFAPKTRFGLFFRNQVIKVSGIPRIARLTFGRDIVDTLQLPTYRWPALELRTS
jgi:2-polyprenyl-6-methoxyphenol hydroxylase-like FAD-dependent oxidoreductase